MSNNQLRLSVFDQDISIKSDSSIFLELLQKTYSHFITTEKNGEGRSPFKVEYYLEEHSNSKHGRLIINGIEKILEEPGLLHDEYIHGIILSALYSRIRSHYLHHAAALTYNNKGVILVGDSGYGKTTLALALVQRGFKFLSDEIAALGREDGYVYPFPRGLHIRQDTLDLLDFLIPVEKASHWYSKYLIDIDDVYPGMIGKPVAVSHIFVLKNLTEPEKINANSHEFKAVISHTHPVFLEKVRCIPEITHVEVVNELGYPCLIIQTNHRMNAISNLEDVCFEEGILILDLVKREENLPNFSPELTYQRILTSQAALELLRRFLGGYKTALLTSSEHQDSSRLLFELTSLLDNANCYQITVGPLTEMMNVITNLVNEHPIANTNTYRVQ